MLLPFCTGATSAFVAKSPYSQSGIKTLRMVDLATCLRSVRRWFCHRTYETDHYRRSRTSEAQALVVEARKQTASALNHKGVLLATQDADRSIACLFVVLI